MTRVAVYLASHIAHEHQLDLMYTCLVSVLWEQSKPPDAVCMSVSFACHRHRLLFESRILRHFFAQVRCLCWDKQRYQMEHLRALHDKYSADFDLLMFVDDDDAYGRHRVRHLTELFADGRTARLASCIRGVRETRARKWSEAVDEIPEYWSYALQPAVLDQFFRCLHDPEDLRHLFSDLYLRTFLRHHPSCQTWVLSAPHLHAHLHPEEIAYHYNEANPTSVCARMRKEEGSVYDWWLARIVRCRRPAELEAWLAGEPSGLVRAWCWRVFSICQRLCGREKLT